MLHRNGPLSAGSTRTAAALSWSWHSSSWLDGLFAGRSVLAAAGIFSVRIMLFRLGPVPDDPAFAAAIERANACMRDGTDERLPPALLAAFRAPPAEPASPRWVTLPPTDSWVLEEGRNTDPTRRDQHEALEWVRALFADALIRL